MRGTDVNEHHAPPRPLDVCESGDLPRDVEVRQFELRYPARWFAPVHQHPRAWDIEEDTISWMRDLGLVSAPEQLDAVRAMYPRVYGGCPVSMVPYEHSLIYTEYVTMWLLWDDGVVESATDMESLRDDFDAMAGIGGSGRATTPYAAAWRHVGDQIERLGGSAALRRRWVDSMRDYGEYAIYEGQIRRREKDYPSCAD